MAHWRHLAPPLDTGHSVWAQGGPTGGGGDVTLHSPRTTTTWETPAERASMWEGVLNTISVSSLSLAFLVYLCNTPSLTCLQLKQHACCLKYNTVRCCFKWIFPPRLCFLSQLPHLATSHKERHNSFVVLALLLRREIQGSCCHTSSLFLSLPPCLLP